MIFLGDLTVINPTQSRVGSIHYIPLDPVQGMKDANGNLLTEDKLGQMGILVDSVPDFQPPEGQYVSAIYVDPITKNVTCDYSATPKSSEQQLADLQAQNAQMLLALVQGGLM